MSDRSSLIALEAAVLFSVVTWVLAAERVWPPDNPRLFTAALLAGATAATALFHVAPALLGRRIFRIAWPVRMWLAAGAVIALAGCARAGILLVVPIPYTAWAGWSMLMAAAFAILSIAIGWPNRAALAGWLSLLLGLGQSITAFVANARGISTHPGQVQLSGGFGQELGMFQGMLFAAVPAAALAFRMGRSGASMRGILWSGVAGVWAPAVLSIALISLAKVGGAQLHHRSSLPVTITYALNIVHTGPGMRIGLLWAGLTTIGPSVVLGLWLRDLTPAGRWPKLATMGIAGGLAAAWELFPLTANWFRDGYPVWCWTVMASILLTGLFLAVARLKFVRRSAD